MLTVIIIKGAWSGRTGTATPCTAYGPIGARIFSVLITLDDGSGTIELPLGAVKVV